MSATAIIEKLAASVDGQMPPEDTHRDGLKSTPKVEMPKATDIGIPSFDDPYTARAYLKNRLALSFRIFAKHGFEDGVAGHITLRVSI